MRLAPNDILFAHIALHVVPDLSPSARRVGAAIIEHFNKRTGQCDPSIERLGRLLGLSPTSVKAATAELCRGDSALFDRIVNGGHCAPHCLSPALGSAERHHRRLGPQIEGWNCPVEGPKNRLFKGRKAGC